MPELPSLPNNIPSQVAQALSEDVGSGDITAMLISENRSARAEIISRDSAVICGTAWVEQVFHQLDPDIVLKWTVEDGDEVGGGTSLLRIEGNARALLTGERTALNFLQLLSGTATRTRQYIDAIAGTTTTLLDTRKTIPGLRLAQKYAVVCGGGSNHRIGLWDAFLIKENHIAASGSIGAAIKAAREVAAERPVEIEVESIAEFREAQASGADIVMLDNFSLDDMRVAVMQRKPGCKLEASGNISLDTIQAVAATGVDYISVGALTKDCIAIDLSMLIDGL